MISLFKCWTCEKEMTEDATEEYFFWCDKNCYDKDIRYHVSTNDSEPKPEIKVADPQTEKEQRRAKIRDAIAKINSKVKDQS